MQDKYKERVKDGWRPCILCSFDKLIDAQCASEKKKTWEKKINFASLFRVKKMETQEEKTKEEGKKTGLSAKLEGSGCLQTRSPSVIITFLLPASSHSFIKSKKKKPLSAHSQWRYARGQLGAHRSSSPPTILAHLEGSNIPVLSQVPSAWYYANFMR